MFYYVWKTFLYFLFSWEFYDHNEMAFLAFLFRLFLRLRAARLIWS